MLCLPGFFPVMKQDHATGETVGTTELIFISEPHFTIFAILGSLPSFSIFVRSE